MLKMKDKTGKIVFILKDNASSPELKDEIEIEEELENTDEGEEDAVE